MYVSAFTLSHFYTVKMERGLRQLANEEKKANFWDSKKAGNIKLLHVQKQELQNMFSSGSLNCNFQYQTQAWEAGYAKYNSQ